MSIEQLNSDLGMTQKFKVVFLTCSYKRPKITEIFLKSLEDVQKKLTNYFEFINIVVDSEETNLSVFSKSNTFNYNNFTNYPISNKWNYGLSLCEHIDFDYVFIIGSDDLIDDKLMIKYHELMIYGYDYFGITDLYFHDSETNKLFYWAGYDLNSGRMGETIGLGRCISKTIVSQFNFKLWDNGINSGLDRSMEYKIKKIPNLKYTSIRLENNYFACDIKSDYNIGKLNSYSNLKLTSKKGDDIKIINPILSIIIPTFNNTDYINECLSSIIKSIKSLDCEILVGIDNCEDTLNLIKYKTFDSRIRFFFFQKNVGPYIVKNTLVKNSNSDTILFFDSDDVMCEHMIEEILRLQSFNDFVRPKYVNFSGVIPTNNNQINNGKLFGEGVFSIKKSIFLTMNGFEEWRTSADTEFMNRLYKNGRKSINTPTVLFYRRIHEDSLTQSKQTGYGSRVRTDYNNLIRNKTNFGPLNRLSMGSFYEILVDSFEPIKIFDETKYYKQIVRDTVNSILNRDKLPKIEIDYTSINKIVQKQGVYIPINNIKPIRENKPIDRTKIIEIRKDSLLQKSREFGDVKKNRKNTHPNIFSKNGRRKNS